MVTTDSDKLLNLAAWFDLKQSMGLWGACSGTEVQDDLRRIADYLKQRPDLAEIEQLVEDFRQAIITYAEDDFEYKETERIKQDIEQAKAALMKAIGGE